MPPIPEILTNGEIRTKVALLTWESNLVIKRNLATVRSGLAFTSSFFASEEVCSVGGEGAMKFHRLEVAARKLTGFN